MLTSKDLNQISELGMDQDSINKQIEQLKKGVKFLNIAKPATIDDGIVQLSKKEIDFYVNYYIKNQTSKTVVKFVPASGAASRMFKTLQNALDKYQNEEDVDFGDVVDTNSLMYFFKNIKDAAFYEELEKVIHYDGDNLDSLLRQKKYERIIEYILTNIGLNYSQMPKALVMFHDYGEYRRYCLEEHLVEAAKYALDEKNVARVHFTVSEEHKDLFVDFVDRLKAAYEDDFGVLFDISYSEQAIESNTVALDTNNEVLRDENGNIVFRPAGHGALIQNLNEIEADIFFIKNIDNVAPDKLKSDTYIYKRALGGILLKLQDDIHNYMSDLTSDNEINLHEIEVFIKEKLNINLPANYNSLDEEDKIDLLIEKLDRPIRVCGMVKNQGEPGGGPYWVSNKKGELSLQIVESSQIDMSIQSNIEMIKNSTHFNPVDIVCSNLDFEGQLYDLNDFVDNDAVFISNKSYNGKDIKALELPGLWNGGMADWITVFVEVPVSTFTPVKTVNDLLRIEHQAQ